jgi:hypothetical protein
VSKSRLPIRRRPGKIQREDLGIQYLERFGLTSSRRRNPDV